MLRQISVALAVFACLGLEYIRGLYEGFLYGASQVCKVSYPTFMSDGFFAFSDADPFLYISEYQACLVIALLIFIVGKLIEKETLSQFVCFLPLILCVLFCVGINSEINLVIRLSNPFAELLRETNFYIQMFFSTIAIVLFLQIVTVSMSLYKKRKATTLK